MFWLLQRIYTLCQGTYRTTQDLYNEFMNTHHEHERELSNFYNIFNQHLGYVKIPTKEIEFCAKFAFFKSVDLDVINQETRKTERRVERAFR